jgi:hypothetical protein
MGLNYMTGLIDARNFENRVLPKWAENEHLDNCDGNIRSFFREYFLDRLISLFK